MPHACNSGSSTQRSRARRLKEMRNDKQLRSFLIHCGSDRNTKNYMRRCCITTFNTHYKDDMKASFSNDAKPAKVSKASFNAYFGKNLRLSKNEKKMLRAAHATGTGASSIGLDPTTMRTHSIFPDLDHLMRLVQKKVRASTRYKQVVFNFVSVKIYYEVPSENPDKGPVQMDTGWHRDVLYKRGTHTPQAGNSQTPGTPVAILTFGDDKELWMARGKTRASPDPNSFSCFVQKHNSFFVLDGDDEKWDNDKVWRHMSRMCKGSKVTFALMFRDVPVHCGSEFSG